MRAVLGFALPALPILLTACAHAPPSPAIVRPAPVVVDVPPPSVRPESVPQHTPEMKVKADEAALAAAVQMIATERECGAQWFGDAACDATFFRPFAQDYQAYYALEKDPAQSESRVDSLARVGGPLVSVEEAATRLSAACEERCRAARLVTIHSATEAAGAACAKASKGYAACEELGKKVAHNLPEREVDLAHGTCEGECDSAREQAAANARRNARRPHTKAQIAACQAECERTQGGGWCGTGLLACLADCSPTPTY